MINIIKPGEVLTLCGFDFISRLVVQRKIKLNQLYIMDNNPTLERAYSYSGFENAETAKHLRAGETCKVTGIGNSMTPILKSR